MTDVLSLKSVPSGPNTGGIQLSVTVWAAAEEQFLWMRTLNMKGKGSDMALCSSEPRLHKRPRWLIIPTKVIRVLAKTYMSPKALVLWMPHIMKCFGSMLENNAACGEDFGCLQEGDSTRCGSLWSSLGRGLLNGVCQCYKVKKKHIHKRGSDLLPENLTC